MFKKSKTQKRVLAVLLSAAMAFTSVNFTPLNTVTAYAEETDPLVAGFDFESEATDNVFVGKNAKATINNADGVAVVDDAERGKVLKLTKSASGFLTVTNEEGKNPIAGCDEITVSYYSKDCNGWTFFTTPVETEQVYKQEKYIGFLQNSGSVEVQKWNNTSDRTPTAIAKLESGKWHHIVAVINKVGSVVYVDGVKAAEAANDFNLTSLTTENSAMWIGKANWKPWGQSVVGEYTDGLIDDFKVYGKALTDEQLALEIGDVTTNAVEVTEDKTAELSVTLPTGVTKDNVEVTYTSANEATATVLADENDATKAVVTGVKPGTTTIEAVVKVSNIEKKVSIPVTVLSADPEQVLKDTTITATPAVELKVNKTGEIEVSLPEKLREVEGLSVSYNSIDKAIATVSANSVDKTKAVITGVSKGNTKVVAYVTLGQTTKQAETAVKVTTVPTTSLIAQYDFEDSLENAVTGAEATPIVKGLGKYNGEIDYIAGRNGKAINLAGKHGIQLNQKNIGSEYTVKTWVKINKPAGWAGPIIALGYGDDPHQKWLSLASKDKNGTYQLWSNTSGVDGYKIFTITNDEWHQVVITGSKGEATLYFDGKKVVTASYDPLTKEWDDKDQDILIGANYWDPTLNGAVDSILVYNEAKTADEVAELYTSELTPSEIFETATVDVENAVTVQEKGAATLDVTINSARELENVTVSANSLKPEVATAEVNEDGKIVVTGVKVGETDVEVTATLEGKTKKAQIAVTVEEKDVLAAGFDFENAATDNVFVGKNAKATINNADGVQVVEDEERGKVLKLTKSAKGFLSITNENGKNPIAGCDEITVSYYSKDCSGWPFFTTPVETDQVYKQEKYIGFIQSPGTVEVQKWNNTSDRTPTAIATLEAGKWHHIVAVINKAGSVVYVDGVKAAEAANDFNLTSLITEDSAMWLGKANWSPWGQSGVGEYTDGLIDDFKVYGKALTDEQLALEIGDVTANALEVTKDKTAELAITLPAGVTSDDVKVTYTSSDDATATVLADAKDATKAVVTGVASGETTIKAIVKAGKIEKKVIIPVTVISADQAAATAVVKLIDAIGEVKLDSKAAIDAARAAYDKLTPEQKKLVSSEKVDVLTAAEAKYEELVAAADKAEVDQAAAVAAVAKIDAIGTVALTDASKAAIDAARAAYDALTADQKALVTADQLKVLTAAEAKYAELAEAAAKKPLSTGTKATGGVGEYTVTNATTESPEVSFIPTATPDATSAVVPATVKIDGIVYKVTKIEPYAFEGFTELKKVTIPSTVTEIGAHAFEACESLKTVTLPADLEVIGDNAFAECEILKSVTIPTKVTTIGKQAFAKCPKLKKITVKSTVLKKVGKNALKGINAKATIKVPKKQLKKYQKLFKKKGQASTVKIKK